MFVRLFFLQFLTIVSIRSVLSIAHCHFCADLTSACKKSDQSANPLIMTCEDFLVNDERPMQRVKHPKWILKWEEIDVFGAGLAERNVKTHCVEIIYKYNPNLQEQGVDMNATYTWRSCMYEDFVHYENACEFFLNVTFTPDGAYPAKCRECYHAYCNSAKRMVLYGLVVLIPLLLGASATSNLF